MPTTDPQTRTISVTEARARWSEVIDAVSRREERLVLEKAGVPVAAIVSMRDLARLRRLDAQRQADLELLYRIGDAFKDIPDDELERDIALAVAEARAELRAEREQATLSA